MNNMLKGIDISDNNGNVTMSKVKAAGYDFVMVKASEGTSFKARTLENNINNAFANGMAVGVYHWMSARTKENAVKEARHFVSCIEPYKSKITLWAAADVEDEKRLSGINPEDLTGIIRAFCDTVRSEGFRPMVYSNNPWFTTRMIYSKLAAYDIWLARWRSNKQKPEGYERAAIWQHDVLGSSEDLKKGYAHAAGSVPGVAGPIDVNYGYFSMPNTGAKKEDPVNKKEPVPSVSAFAEKFEKGDKVKVINAVKKGNIARGKAYDGSAFRLYYDVYEVFSCKGDRVVIGVGAETTAAVSVNDLEKIDK